MFPGTHARLTPDKPAIVMAGSGASVSYAELDTRSRRFARYLYDDGVRPGDHLAVLTDNRADRDGDLLGRTAFRPVRHVHQLTAERR